MRLFALLAAGEIFTDAENIIDAIALRQKADRHRKIVRKMLSGKVKPLKCLQCSGKNYDECYSSGRDTECLAGGCALEVRYWGQQVVQVQAGCQQKDACISNMKQNFWQREGQIFDLNNPRRHQCKIFSGNHALNSVCHTCCFDDNCNKKIQPNSIEEWMNIKGKSQEEHVKLFTDQSLGIPQSWAAEAGPTNYKKSKKAKNAPNATQKPKTQKAQLILSDDTVLDLRNSMKFSLNANKKGEETKKINQAHFNHIEARQEVLSESKGSESKNSAVAAPQPQQKSGMGPWAVEGWADMPEWKRRQLARLKARQMIEQRFGKKSN